MIYIVFFILFFAVIRFGVAFINFVFWQPLTGNKLPGNILVSVLVPARNEENNLPVLLNCLVNQSHKNIEVLVYNDFSDDNTPNIVKKFTSTDNRVKLINPDILPLGWLGKNNACYKLAQQAKGSFYLFLDADVTINNNGISELVAYTIKHKLSLLSVFPQQIMQTPGEWATVPFMNMVLLSLLPLIFVQRSSFSSLSAANGQCMLFNAGCYIKYQPHSVMRNQKAEDIAIARWLKKQNLKIACIASTNIVKCRMYTSYKQGVNGFSKNITAFFGNNFLLAFFYWLITTLGFVFIFIYLPIWVFALYVFVAIATRTLISVTSRQNVINNIIYTVHQQITFFLILFFALKNKIYKNYKWKGRNIY